MRRARRVLAECLYAAIGLIAGYYACLYVLEVIL